MVPSVTYEECPAEQRRGMFKWVFCARDKDEMLIAGKVVGKKYDDILVDTGLPLLW